MNRSRSALFVSLFVFFCSFSAPARSVPVAFKFAGVPLVDFAQFAYRDLLKRDYVVSAELLGMNKRVTVNVAGVDDTKLAPFVEQVLLSQGVRSVQRGGVFFLESSTAPALDAPASSPVQAVTSPGAVPAGAVAPVPGAVSSGVAQVVQPVELEFRVVRAVNRSVDFLAAAVNAVAGSNVARVAGGNRLALAASKERIKPLVALVEQLDVAADVVEVSASFVEVTTSDAASSGLSLVNSALSAGAVMRSGVSVVPSAGQITVRGGRYELVLEALARDGRFKQVSNSRVVGDDAEKLLLSVGDETPTLGSSSTDNQGNLIQNVVYRPSGVILDVLPRVMGSGRLSLTVDGQVSAFQSTTTGIANSPTLVKRQVKTAVSLGDGDVLVIGGLTDTKSTGATAGFSFLPTSWRTRSASDVKTDLVLILSARVLARKHDDT
jgi:general secretion pathway protein D